ncbi:MAG: DUF2177 family protein [Bacteroidetes bacterium]|nr:DUF2177 family protein [Bacteroidota bacterium]
MIYYLKLYFATLAVFFAVDMFWLGVISRTFYKKQLGFLMAPDINWYAALIFYFLFISGVLVFVVIPGLKENALPVMLVKAALFGLITYATYDLTNLATVKDWPLIITIVDLIWGMVLTTTVSLAGFFIGRWMA